MINRDFSRRRLSGAKNSYLPIYKEVGEAEQIWCIWDFVGWFEKVIKGCFFLKNSLTPQKKIGRFLPSF